MFGVPMPGLQGMQPTNTPAPPAQPPMQKKPSSLANYTPPPSPNIPLNTNVVNYMGK
jgi:hypothetical protein